MKTERDKKMQTEIERNKIKFKKNIEGDRKGYKKRQTEIKEDKKEMEGDRKGEKEMNGN